MSNINKIQAGETTYDITPSSTGTFDGTSEDSASPTSWTDVAVLTTGETNGSIFTKISNMFKNIRYLYSRLGTTDISGIGNSITEAISALNTNKAPNSTFTSAANGLVPAANDGGTTNYATSAYVLTGDGWKAGTKYNTDTTYAVFTTASDSTNGTSGLVPAPTTFSYGKTLYLNSNKSWTTPTNTTYAVMGAATSEAAGTSGLVPAPGSGKQASFLRGDKTWAVPTNTTYTTFTSAANGLVPAAKSGSTSYLTSGYVLTGAGWKAGDKYNTDTNTTYTTFTSAANGLVPAAKSGSTSYLTSGYVLTGAGWKAGTKYNTDTTYSVMGAATSAAAGTAGLVPAPAAGKQASFLRGDKTWAVPTNTTYALNASGVKATYSSGTLTLNPLSVRV